MGSRERLWEKYGAAWGWPSATMSYEADRQDLARHEVEIAAHETFNYAVLDEHERELLGCVYIDPPDEHAPPASDAVVSWWLVDHAVGTELERELAAFVPRWLAETWGFEAVHYHPWPDGRHRCGHIVLADCPAMAAPIPEHERLEEARTGRVPWKAWGPYLSERQWGTVREDYSEGGDAWSYFSHDQARSRAYRWGEDGLAGFSDDRQRLCFGLALWNGQDPILKERLFG